MIGEQFMETLFLNDVFNISNANDSSGCIIILCNYVVAMLIHLLPMNPFSTPLKTLENFLFDSHCRNSRRIIDGEIGFSILTKFEGLFQIKRYTEEAYQISDRMYAP